MANWGSNTTLLNFGTVTVGTSVESSPIFAYNYDENYTKNITLSSSDPTHFILNKTGMTLPRAPSSDSYTVTFHPTAAGTISATITLTCTSATCDPVTLTKTVTGTGGAGATYTLTLSLDPGGANMEVHVVGSDGTDDYCASSCGYTFDAGTTVTLTAAGYNGWSFDYWTGACTGGSSSCIVTMNANRGVTAVFFFDAPDPTMSASFQWNPATPDPLVGCTLTATYLWSNIPSNGSSACVSIRLYNPGEQSFCQQWSTTLNCSGGTHQLSCSPTLSAGIYVARGWFWNGSNMQEMNPVYIEVFEEVTYCSLMLTTPTGDGSIDVMTHSECISPGECPCGTVVQLLAVADNGWRFDNWTGSETGSTNPLNVLLDVDKSISAVFSPIVVSCTDPPGENNQIICGVQGTAGAPDPTHRYKCNNTVWSDLGVCQYGCLAGNCNAAPCVEGTEQCISGYMNTCTGGVWTPNVPAESCEERPWWITYLPFIAAGAGVLIIASALLMSRPKPPLYYPPPQYYPPPPQYPPYGGR